MSFAEASKLIFPLYNLQILGLGILRIPGLFLFSLSLLRIIEKIFGHQQFSLSNILAGPKRENI